MIIGRKGMLVATTRSLPTPRMLPLLSPDLFALTLATSNAASFSCAGTATVTTTAQPNASASFRIAGRLPTIGNPTSPRDSQLRRVLSSPAKRARWWRWNIPAAEPAAAPNLQPRRHPLAPMRAIVRSLLRWAAGTRLELGVVRPQRHAASKFTRR